MRLILIAAAVIPALFLLIQTYRSDRLEKEPLSMLLGLVLCGIIATELATLAEGAGVLCRKRMRQSSANRHLHMGMNRLQGRTMIRK